MQILVVKKIIKYSLKPLFNEQHEDFVYSYRFQDITIPRLVGTLHNK